MLSQQARSREKMKEEVQIFAQSFAAQFTASHFGYVGIAASGYFFKLAIATTVASYVAFLSALIVGGLLTCFASLALKAGLEYFNINRTYRNIAGELSTLALSPVVGALVLNTTLGWGLALAPMLVIGGVSSAMLLGVIAYIHMDNNEAKLTHSPSPSPSIFSNSPKNLNRSSDEEIASNLILDNP